MISLDYFTVHPMLAIALMREPVPPLALLQARANVLETLSTSETTQRIREWHFQIQMWQDNDELVRAFLEGRLTHRTMSHAGGRYDYGGRNDTNLLGIINNDDYYKPILNEANGKPVHKAQNCIQPRHGSSIRHHEI